MKKQFDLIHNTPWNYLIILDACRYDYFRDSNFIDGDLIPVQSIASTTEWWIEETFQGYIDVPYFSGNPLINTIEATTTSRVRVPATNYHPKEHFKELLDIWFTGWDKYRHTVPASSLNEAVLERNPPAAIIHYMQPHAPWIGKTKLQVDTSHSAGMERQNRKSFLKTWHGFAQPKILQSVNWSIELVRKAYKDNIIYVLEYVQKLLNHLDGMIIVTADHGEFLGEKIGDPKSHDWLRPRDERKHQLFGHPNVDHPFLRTVPWLVLQK